MKERENDREKSHLGIRSRVGFCVLVKIIQYFFNKVTLNVMDDKAVFMIVTKMDESTREILEVIQKNQMN